MPDDPNHPLTPPLSRARLRLHGLDRPPFDAVPEADFLYGDPAVDMPVTLLLERLRTDDPLLVLTGDSGVGKSTQLRRLLLQGTKFGTFCAFKARPGTPFAAIEQTLRQHWITAASTEPTPPLADWLSAMCREGHQLMVVIDDAHHLTPAALGELLRLRQTVRRRCPRGLRLLLAGAPGLAQRLEANADADSALEPVVEVALRAFTQEQTEAYLRHRLLAAGAREPDRLSGDIAHAIHQQSGGLPRGINVAANRHLQGPPAPTPSEGTPAKAQARDPGPPRSAAARSSEAPGTTGRGASGITRLLQDPGALRLVLVGVLVGLVILVLITLLAPPNDDAPDSLGLPAPEAIPESGLAATPGPSAGTTSPSSEPAPLPTPLDPTPLDPKPLEPTRLGTQHPADVPFVPGLQTDPAPESATESDSESTAESRSDSARDPPPREAQPPSDPLEDATNPISGFDVSQAVGRDTPPTAAEPDPVEVRPVPPVHTEPGAPPPPARAPGPAPAPVAGPRPVQEIGWIRRQNPGHWTLQIAAGGDRLALQEQARRLADDDAFAPGAEVAWFQTRRNGRDWYTLILGPYPTAQAAQAAVAALPASLRRQQPWARDFNAIHQLLDSGR